MQNSATMQNVYQHLYQYLCRHHCTCVKNNIQHSRLNLPGCPGAHAVGSQLVYHPGPNRMGGKHFADNVVNITHCWVLLHCHFYLVTYYISMIHLAFLQSCKKLHVESLVSGNKSTIQFIVFIQTCSNNASAVRCTTSPARDSEHFCL